MSTLIARVARTWCLRADDPTCVLSTLLTHRQPVPIDVAENALFNLKKVLQRVEAITPDNFRRSSADLRAAIDELQIMVDKGVPMNVARESTEGRELDLYAENTSALYPQKVAILRNLLLKMKRGVYDPAKATILWEHWYESAARAYAREHSVGTDWSMMFPKRIRMEAAAKAEAHYRSELRKGEHNYALSARESGTAHEYTWDIYKKTSTAYANTTTLVKSFVGTFEDGDKEAKRFAERGAIRGGFFGVNGGSLRYSGAAYDIVASGTPRTTTASEDMENTMHTPNCVVPPHAHKIHGYAMDSGGLTWEVSPHDTDVITASTGIGRGYTIYESRRGTPKKHVIVFNVYEGQRAIGRVSSLGAAKRVAEQHWNAAHAQDNPFSQSEKTGGLIAAVAVGAAALIWALWPKSAAASPAAPGAPALPAGVSLENCAGSWLPIGDISAAATIPAGLYRVQASVSAAMLATLPDAATAPTEIYSAIQQAVQAQLPFQIELVYIDAFTTSTGQIVGPIVYPAGASVPADWPQINNANAPNQGASLPQIKIRGQVRLLQDMPSSGAQNSLNNANNNGVTLDGIWQCVGPNTQVNAPTPVNTPTPNQGGTVVSAPSPHQGQQVWAPVTTLKQGKKYRISAGVPAVLQTNHFNDFQLYRDASSLPAGWPAQDMTADARWRVEGTWPMADYTIPQAALTDAYGNPRFYELV